MRKDGSKHGLYANGPRDSRLPLNIDNYSFKRRDQVIKKKRVYLFSYEKGNLRESRIKQFYKRKISI